MKSVWKFELHPYTSVRMPVGATPLYVGAQGDAICLWAKVETEGPWEVRSFVIVGTGHELPEHTGKYLGTAMLSNGALVFHVFDTKTEFKAD